MNVTIDAVAAGHICVDISPVFPATLAGKLSEVLKPGKLVNVCPVKISLGGPVSNTGLALKRFGLRVVANAGLGADDIGSMAANLLKAEGVGDTVKLVADQTTSYTIVIAIPGIDRIFLHCPGKNDSFSTTDIDWDAVRNARLFHFGYPPLMKCMYERDGALLEEIFRRAKEAGAITSLDMSLPDPASESGHAHWGKILERTLPFVDIFLPSIEEIFFMLEKDRYCELRNQHPDVDLVEHLSSEHYARLAATAVNLGAGFCVVKTARRGYYLRSSGMERISQFGERAPRHLACWLDRELWAPAYHVPVIASATGSGDSSIAGFLSAFLRDEPPEQCMRLANAAGHHNLLALDALSGLPSWEALLDFIAGAPPTEDPNLDPHHFIYDAHQNIYHGTHEPVKAQPTTASVVVG